MIFLTFLSAIFPQIENGTLFIVVTDLILIDKLFQSLFNASYLDFWAGVGGRSRLPPAILLILPAAAACPALNLSETRAAGAPAVTLSTAGPTRILQHRGCGQQGHSLAFAWRRQPGDPRELMVLLARLLFGVFPEAGAAGSGRYPLFHQSEDEVRHLANQRVGFGVPPILVWGRVFHQTKNGIRGCSTNQRRG